jgi:hypothetical protein
VEEDPGTSVRRTAAVDGIGVPLVWRILHELYPYHIQRVQALTSPEHLAKQVFCQWLLTNCRVVNTQSAANMLFTDEMAFIRDGIVKFHNSLVIVDDTPHTIVASKHQYRFSINVWLGIGLAVLPNRLSGAVYHRFLVNDLLLLLEHVPPLHHRQHMWFMLVWAPPYFFALSDST